MKKWFFGFLVLLILALGAIYILVPNKQEIARTAYINIGSDIVHRHLADQTAWQRWWPGKIDTAANAQPGYFIDNVRYSVSHELFTAVEIKIVVDGDTIKSTILVVSLKPDSTALHWRGSLETAGNFFGKVKGYREAATIQNHMDKVFTNLKQFLQSGPNFYKVSIDRGRIRDTLLISIKKDFDRYPATNEIYELVNSLRKYISQKSANETSYPMLNIAKIDRNRFRVMVAIPVNKFLPDEDPFALKRMVPGNTLVTDVKGGRYTIEKALAELELYIKENKLTPPAIPFESMITDRTKEPDTAKWQTRIYYPIL